MRADAIGDRHAKTDQRQAAGPRAGDRHQPEGDPVLLRAYRVGQLGVAAGKADHQPVAGQCGVIGLVGFPGHVRRSEADALVGGAVILPRRLIDQRLPGRIVSENGFELGVFDHQIAGQCPRRESGRNQGHEPELPAHVHLLRLQDRFRALPLVRLNGACAAVPAPAPAGT